MKFAEVSAKTNDNLEKTMNEFIFEIVKEKIKVLKDIYMNFLLFLNEDFDDDLLFDAISLLSNKWFYLLSSIKSYTLSQKDKMKNKGRSSERNPFIYIWQSHMTTTPRWTILYRQSTVLLRIIWMKYDKLFINSNILLLIKEWVKQNQNIFKNRMKLLIKTNKSTKNHWQTSTKKVLLHLNILNLHPKWILSENNHKNKSLTLCQNVHRKVLRSRLFS